ncbi:META domain-containing protein [Zavarzinia compransoris]|nr:META domain-containing protein [Zavarzinia compransoris]TDP44477.1 heat shock protein HslJ [Zavarzinia compransoris]
MQRKFVALAATMILTAACESLPAAGGPGLSGTTWQLETLGGQPVPADNIPTLAIAEDGRVSGFAGCNRYMGGTTIAGDKLSFTQMASTRMACLNVTIELDYLASLENVAAYRIEDGRLSLIDAVGHVLSTYRPGA